MTSPHPRARIQNAAQADLQKKVLEWLKEHDLTTIEELLIAQAVLGGMITGTLRLCLREERSGDVDQLEAKEEVNGRHRRD